MSQTTVTREAQETLFFKQMAHLVSAIGGTLTPASESADYLYRLSYKNNVVRARNLDNLLDWFQYTGQQQFLIDAGNWTIDGLYDDICAVFPFINASNITANSTIRLPYSKSKPWKVLRVLRREPVNIIFEYTVDDSDSTFASFNNLWKFQLLAIDGVSAQELGEF